MIKTFRLVWLATILKNQAVKRKINKNNKMAAVLPPGVCINLKNEVFSYFPDHIN